MERVTDHVSHIKVGGLGRLFFGHHAKVIVEIGADLLKVCQFWTKGKEKHHFVKVLRLAEMKEPLHEELPAFLRSLGLRNTHVTTYLPRKLVNMRLIEVPSTDPGEVADIIRLQGVKQTPYSREEVILSHTIVGSRQEGHSDVVLAFCQRKFVDERIDLLEKAGLHVEQVLVGSEGVVDWYMKNQTDYGLGPPKDPIALIDCDSSFSDVIFCRDGRFLYSRSVPIGCGQLLRDATAVGIEQFCKEVFHGMEFTAEEIRITSIKKAVLIASLPDAAKVREALEKKLGVPVDYLNPALDLEGLEGPEDEAKFFPQEGGALTSLLGFTRTKEANLFDLMPEEMQAKISVEQKGRQAILTGALALGLLAIVTLFFAGHFYKKKAYLDQLNKEIEKTDSIASRIEEKLIRTKLFQRTKNPEASLLHFLDKISGLLPAGMQFNSIDFTQDEKIILKGNAGEMSEVFSFVKTLEESKIFEGVKSEHVSKKKSGDQVLAEFEIVCRI